VAAKKPSQPWKVVFFTAAAPLPEKKFRSQAAMHRAINGERDLIREGSSRVVRATAFQWDAAAGRWMTFERYPLKAEVDAEAGSE
jgi:hypothetical protein